MVGIFVCCVVLGSAPPTPAPLPSFSGTSLIVVSTFPIVMPNLSNLEEIIPVVNSLVVLLENVVETMFALEEACTFEDGKPTPTLLQLHNTLVNMEAIVSSVLHNFRFSNACSLLGADVGY